MERSISHHLAIVSATVALAMWGFAIAVALGAVSISFHDIPYGGHVFLGTPFQFLYLGVYPADGAAILRIIDVLSLSMLGLLPLACMARRRMLAKLALYTSISFVSCALVMAIAALSGHLAGVWYDAWWMEVPYEQVFFRWVFRWVKIGLIVAGQIAFTFAALWFFRFDPRKLRRSILLGGCVFAATVGILLMLASWLVIRSAVSDVLHMSGAYAAFVSAYLGVMGSASLFCVLERIAVDDRRVIADTGITQPRPLPS